MSSKHRIEVGNEYANKKFEDIRSLGFNIAINGTEYTHPDFTEKLRQSNDQTSLIIRFQPDAAICIGKIPRSCLVDPKAGVNIEKLAWEQYQRLVSIGCIVIAIFGGYNDAWNFVDEIVLISGEDTIKHFPVEQQLPVVDEWITPRGSDRWEEIRRSCPMASGTPYRKVDRDSLRPWRRFKEDIIQRLELVEIAA